MYLQLRAIKDFDPVTSAHELNCMLFLDCKLTVLKYDNNNTRFVGLEVCAVGK